MGLLLLLRFRLLLHLCFILCGCCVLPSSICFVCPCSFCIRSAFSTCCSSGCSFQSSFAFSACCCSSCSFQSSSAFSTCSGCSFRFWCGSLMTCLMRVLWMWLLGTRMLRFQLLCPIPIVRNFTGCFHLPSFCLRALSLCASSSSCCV